MKILLDTDIGCDIDDCLALAYLLGRRDVELLGITTVTGAPHLRACLAHAVCLAAGQRVPVRVGLSEPTSGILRQEGLTVNQQAVAECCPFDCTEEETAIEFMRRTVEASPHEVTLVAIGPLTNVATLFTRYPHIPALLGGLAVMGGRYTEDPAFDTSRWGEAEWNILCDREAAATVFSRCASPCLVIGVEETCRFSIPPRPLKALLRDIPRWRPVSDAIPTTVERIYFHDALLAYALLAPEEVETARGTLAVEAERGATRFTPVEGGPFRLVTGYKPERFWADYQRSLGISLSI